ncbi:hypothetical protein GQX74_010663 [Glossina fuscipes]|nr:hypothetical protein GQX74_010663 [Glossina fuscipes]
MKTASKRPDEDFVRATTEDNVAELYRDPMLQQSASLALVRFMCVSPRVCGSYMPFLMNILSHNKNINIKCSIGIGISELTFRFPNIMEPSTGHFYSTLHNENTELRFERRNSLTRQIRIFPILFFVLIFCDDALNKLPESA